MNAMVAGVRPRAYDILHNMHYAKLIKGGTLPARLVQPCRVPPTYNARLADAKKGLSVSMATAQFLLHVVEATTPHQRHALKRWHDTGGKMDYLGEWHTHPEQHPCPSCIDLPMLFLIAGVGGHDWLGMAISPS